MPARGGFWSYVHADDAAEQGRIRRLASDLAEQYALITGEAIEIFVDREALAWGDNWREQINASLASMVFFIPVITPRYFQSVECRRELQTFATGADNLGVHELVLPLVYADVPALADESPVDEAIALVKTYQWVDWRDLRFEEVNSGSYRRGVAALAARLAAANQTISSMDLTQVEPPETPEDDAPGRLDRLAAGEVAIVDISVTLTALTERLEEANALTVQATQDVQVGDQQGKGFAARLLIVRRLAQQLSEPAKDMLDLASQFTKSIYDADIAVREIIAAAPAEAETEQALRDNWPSFATPVKQLADVTRTTVEMTRPFVESLSQTEAQSRDLRRPVQDMRRAMTILTEGCEVIGEWKTLVEQSPLEDRGSDVTQAEK